MGGLRSLKRSIAKAQGTFRRKPKARGPSRVLPTRPPLYRTNAPPMPEWIRKALAPKARRGS